jgi:AcrR family transcriptional regulator
MISNFADAHPSAPPMRSDAARNRAAILAAARDLFGRGRDVPMYEIARRAGVGQATLYRHFRDRPAIVASLTLEHIERIEAVAADTGSGEPVAIVLRAGADMLVCIQDLLGILRDDETLAPILDEIRRRMLVVLQASLARSRAGGCPLREDLDAADLMLILKMVNGTLVGVANPNERAATAGRALGVALHGVYQPPKAV